MKTWLLSASVFLLLSSLAMAESLQPENVVRMTAPVSMDFELELVPATARRQEDRYVVVAVHP
jgi:hypothetical protein